MSVRRVVLWSVLGLVVLVGCIAVGRWERHHAAARNVTAMDAILRDAGAVASRSLSGFRTSPNTCLFYAAGTNPYAYELCFTPDGRLFQAALRNGAAVRYWWLGWDLAAAPRVTTSRSLRSVVSKAESLGR